MWPGRTNHRLDCRASDRQISKHDPTRQLVLVAVNLWDYAGAALNGPSQWPGLKLMRAGRIIGIIRTVTIPSLDTNPGLAGGN
jgi:hypothetical protein